jgi:hypothetical protein
LLLLLAALNLYVPRRFGWAAELQRLSLFTRQVFVVHAGFIVLTLVLFGLLSLALADELLEPSSLARAVLAGLTLFWLARLLVQWLFYDRSLWRGKTLETSVHVTFTLVWLYFTATYSAALWLNLTGAAR